MREFSMFQVDAFRQHGLYRQSRRGSGAAGLAARGQDAGHCSGKQSCRNRLRDPRCDGHAIRWFTPLQEVAFCGHATLASAHILASEYSITGPIRFTTRKVGALTVTPLGDGAYRMDLPAPGPHPLMRFRTSSARSFRTDGPPPAETSRISLLNCRQPMPFWPMRPTSPPSGPWARRGSASPQRAARATTERLSTSCRATSPRQPAFRQDPVTGSAHSTLIPYWTEKLGTRMLAAFQASPRGGLLEGRLAGDRVELTGRAARSCGRQFTCRLGPGFRRPPRSRSSGASTRYTSPKARAAG